MRLSARSLPYAAALLFAASLSPAAAQPSVELITATGHPNAEHLVGAPEQMLCVRAAPVGSHVPSGRTCAKRAEWRQLAAYLRAHGHSFYTVPYPGYR